jgi:exportin-2 (importin alpha re-exporter)
MQQNKTNSYVYYFVYFLLYMLAINVDGLTPDYLIQTIDEIQPGYVGQLFTVCCLLRPWGPPCPLGYGLK